MGKDFENLAKFAKENIGISSLKLKENVENSINGLTTPFVLEQRSLNVTTFDIFSRLMLDRIIFLSGEVTQESMDIITAQLLYLDSIDNRDINIYINSGGGDCYSGLQLISVMDFIKSEVSTTVLGIAASMAAVIASNGEKGKRFILPYSRFMIHQPSSYNGYSKYTDSKIALQEMESVRNDLYEILAKNSGKSVEETIQLCENGDRWMKSQEAIDLGYVDKIVIKS